MHKAIVQTTPTWRAAQGHGSGVRMARTGRARNEEAAVALRHTVTVKRCALFPASRT